MLALIAIEFPLHIQENTDKADGSENPMNYSLLLAGFAEHDSIYKLLK